MVRRCATTYTARVLHHELGLCVDAVHCDVDTEFVPPAVVLAQLTQ